MKYDFPEIRHINDVLPHIKEWPSFIIAEKDHYTVANYRLGSPEMFDMRDPADVPGAIRRECRGILFDKAGNLISRPFEKFFNVGERPETMPHLIDLRDPHTLVEKEDGSMIRPIIVEGFLRLGTKMGCTHVSNNAEAWLVVQPDRNLKEEWLREQISEGRTPIFEWISNKNRIVLDHKQDDLVLLAVRDNLTGQYEDLRKLSGVPFTIVTHYGEVNGNLDQYIEKARQQEGREGDILLFADGRRYKIKNDWYLRIHRVLDLVANERRVVELIMRDGGDGDDEKAKFDDVISVLNPDDAAIIMDWNLHLWAAIQAKAMHVIRLYDISANHLLYPNRKAVAVWFMNNDGGEIDVDEMSKNLGLTDHERWFLESEYQVADDERQYIFKLHTLVENDKVKDENLFYELTEIIKKGIMNSLSSQEKWHRMSENLGLKPLDRTSHLDDEVPDSDNE